MLKTPLTEQDIINVKDENALVMDIWHELERLANSYMQECTNIQNGYKTKVENMKSDHAAQINRMNTNHAQQISQLEYEESSALEQWENQYKTNQRTTNQKKDNARKAQEDVKNNSDKYKRDMDAQIANQKKKLQGYLDEISNAEKTIKAKRYKKVAKNSTELAQIDATSMEQLMCRNPKFMAKEINELDEKLLKKLIHPSLLKTKCIEFFSLKCKAQELFDKEIREQDSIMPETDKKVAAMVAEAARRMQNELQQLNSNAEQERQAYVKYRVELEQKYADKRKSLFQQQASTKQNLLHQHESEDALAKKNREDALINATKKYQSEHIFNLPPAVLKKFVDSMMVRKVYGAQGYQTAKIEPLNVTVGYVYFKFDQFLTNKIVSQFMTQNYGFILKNGAFVFPYTVAINESLALCYKYSNKNADMAKANMQTICMNTFLATPPNKMRFHFFDPLKSGQSFAVFKHFEEDNSTGTSIILGGIQTEANSVEQQLQIVVDHIKNMQVNTFKGQYKNIREYNAANTLNPQPYNIVGIMDFPAGFTAKSIELLSQVVATGKECGVYVVIMANDEQLSNMDPKIKGQITNIEQMCTCFSMVEPGYICDELNNDNIRFLIDKPLDIKEIVSIAPVMKKGIKDAGRIIINYEHIAPSPAQYLKFSTDDGISIPIGLSGASDIQSLKLGMQGSQSIHALICGQIGSGKSRLLHAIITGALLQYPAEELQIYLIDFKSGTEFKIYADYNLPNFKVIAIESEQEFGLSVLRDIKREGERRAQIFNTCTKSDITSYNNSPDVQRYGRMPRVLIVIDEFHVLFSDRNQEVATEASQIMDGILRLDRSYGFHIVLCSQSIRGMNAISEAALAQIAVRIALKCPKEDADIVLGKGSDAIAQIEENDAGSAIYVPAISSPKTNIKFRVGYLDPQVHVNLLEQLDKHYTSKGIRSTARVLASDVSDSRSSVYQTYFAGNDLVVKDRVLHLGEPLRVDANLEVRFDQTNGNNMLLLGKNGQKAQNLLFFTTLDLILQRVARKRSGMSLPNITVINYCDGSNTVLDDKLQDMGLRLPGFCDYHDGSEAVEAFEDVYERFARKTTSDPDEWLIISQLALASDFQGGSIYGSNREYANKFEELLRDGPSKGVFVIAWCDDPALFRAKFDNTFSFFGKRVVFDVSKEDALALADIVNDDSINKNNAYIWQAGKGKEKFRPYSTPMTKWVESICDEKINKE
ncbi:FtsK/SpoIIIE domain-containing protein [Butyrivibrio sp. AC2005]|uniref:FtsK/SpoIIIE domain-containing protein n=1 Tax=Butyrivibrio sp. AC2005 TaxID=1280672 RepID=UPI000410BAB3|nr:FtsK/SpoIIIE domain-containing protein [Butyrivibrio sp. AC2005]